MPNLTCVVGLQSTLQARSALYRSASSLALTRVLVLQSARQKPHEQIQDDPFLKAMHANAEHFDPATEALFRYLQVCWGQSPSLKI